MESCFWVFKMRYWHRFYLQCSFVNMDLFLAGNSFTKKSSLISLSCGWGCPFVSTTFYSVTSKRTAPTWTITTFGGPLPFHSVSVESCTEVVGIWETKHKSAATMYTDYYGLLPLLVTSWEYIHTETRNVVTSTSRMNAVTIVQFIITTHDTHYVCHHRGEYQSLQKNAKDSFISFLAWVFFGMN